MASNNDVVFSVQQITENLEKVILSSAGLQSVRVIGEITEFKIHDTSGHIYLTLKDKHSQVEGMRRAVLSCTYFRQAQKALNFTLRAGIEVEVYGSLRVFMARGQYNFNILGIRKAGEGNLLLQIEERRQKLAKEGLSDPARKRALPLLPSKIGVVTGLGTAALRDILKQVLELHPTVDVLIAPAQVQGESAPSSLIAALSEISRKEYGCEVIIISRGGGSTEDLMAFNDEALCRAIAACPVPVISAVGHQIDHPISDDVADVAAATPTDGAKQALKDVKGLSDQVDRAMRIIERNLELKLDMAKQRLESLSSRKIFDDPSTVIVNERWLLLDDLTRRLSQALREGIDKRTVLLLHLGDLTTLTEHHLKAKRALLQPEAARLEAFSPMATLKRGYSIVYQDGKVLKNKVKLQYNKHVEVQLVDGNFTAHPQKN